MQTVGEVLRAEREKQGISIKDVEKGTSIRALYIQAIEDGNYNILPGEVYLKGFIRNYGNFLGINGQEMVDLYRQNQSPPPPAVAVEPPKPESRKEEKGSGGSFNKWLIGLVAIILLAGIAWGAMALMSDPSPQPAPPPPIQQVKPVPAPAPQTPAPSTPATPAAKPVVIVAKYTAASWTQVIADDKEVYEGIPKVGDTLTWSADRVIILRVGNAIGVDITYNGQPQAKLGGDGDVAVKTYTAANAANTQRP